MFGVIYNAALLPVNKVVIVVIEHGTTKFIFPVAEKKGRGLSAFRGGERNYHPVSRLSMFNVINVINRWHTMILRFE